MSVSASPESPLFSRVPVVVEPRKPPVVVVGLPRSGSTFLSHVMSTIDDWYVFDDLDFYRQAKAAKADGPLTREQLGALVHFLGWQVRARIRYEEHFFRPQCTWEDVDRMCEAVTETFRERPVAWHELMEEWMMRLALHHGMHRWGYKTPRDFMNMPELARVFPGVRFVFIMRDPRKMMASMKYVPKRDGKPGQYHPCVYANYWKMAYEVYRRTCEAAQWPILLVRFESLVKDPDTEARRIAEFLGATISRPVTARGSNTSFIDGKRKDITQTERWICERMAGLVMDEAGYARQNPRPRLADLPDLLFTTGRFACHQTWRLLRRPDARVAVGAYLRRMFGRP